MAEIWHAGGLGHKKANGDGWRCSGPHWTWPGPAPSTTGPSFGPWGGAGRLKFGKQVVLAIRKPMGMVGDVRAHLGLGQGQPQVPQVHLLGIGEGLEG